MFEDDFPNFPRWDMYPFPGDLPFLWTKDRNWLDVHPEIYTLEKFNGWEHNVMEVDRNRIFRIATWVIFRFQPLIFPRCGNKKHILHS